MSGRNEYPIPSNAVSSPLGDEYQGWVIAHFTGVEPEAVAVNEYPLYFDYLTRLAWWGKGMPRPPPESRDDLAHDPKAEVLLKALHFAPLAEKHDAKLAASARDWL